MKSFRFYFPGINPISRDLVLVVLTGLMISIILVLVAGMIFIQY